MNSSYWSDKLKEWRDKQGITSFLKLKMDTRWYTFTSMCHSVYIFKEGFKEMLPSQIQDQEDEAEEPKLPADIIKIIKSSIFDDALFLYNLTKPIMTSIGVLEENTAHLGMIWEEFVKLHKFIKAKIDDQSINRLPELYKNTIDLLEERFNKRAKNYDEPIYLVAIFLTPEYRHIACGGKYTLEDYTLMMIDLAIAWNFSLEDTVDIGDGFQMYYDNIDPHYGSESNPVKYWKSMTQQPQLSRFALMVFAIYASSGKVERLFSIMSCTKTKKLNKMSKATVTDIAKIKLDFRHEASKLKNKDKEGPTCVDENDDYVEDDLIEVHNEDEDDGDVSSTTVVEEIFDLSLMPFKKAEKRKAEPGKPFTAQDVLKLLNKRT